MTTNEKYAMNRTIGIFMGGEVLGTESYDNGRSEIVIERWKVPQGIAGYDDSAKIGYFHYDLHWDRLMSVIEKIEEMGHSVIISRTTCKIVEDFKIYPIIDKTSDTKIDSVYLAICEFVKKYNHEKFLEDLKNEK